MAKPAKPKKRKRKWNWLRYRKGDLAHNVQVAVQRWIHGNGGTAVVLGGIGIMDEGGHRYQVCVGALGIIPEKKPIAPSQAGRARRRM